MSQEDNNLVMNDQIVELVSQSVHRGSMSLKHVPDLMRDIIVNERWKKRHIRQIGQIKEFATFVEFVETAPLEGLGTRVDTIKALCASSPDVLRMIEAVVEDQDGNVKDYPYFAVYIQASHPELAEQILLGELSIRDAAKLLGHDVKRVRLHPTDIERTGEKIIEIFNKEWKRDSKKALSELVKYLSKYTNN